MQHIQNTNYISYPHKHEIKYLTDLFDIQEFSGEKPPLVLYNYEEPLPTNKLCIYIHVCHVLGIHKILSFTDYKSNYNVIHIYSDKLCNDPTLVQNELLNILIRKADVIIYQTLNPSKNKHVYDFMNSNTKCIKIPLPYIHMNNWSFTFYDHTNYDIIINEIKKNIPIHAIIDNFNSGKYIKFQSRLEEQKKNNFNKIKTLCNHSSFDVSSLEKELNSDNSFFTPNHINTNILYLYADHISKYFNINDQLCNKKLCILQYNDIGEFCDPNNHYSNKWPHSIYDNSKNNEISIFNVLIYKIYDIYLRKQYTDSYKIWNEIEYSPKSWVDMQNNQIFYENKFRKVDLFLKTYKDDFKKTILLITSLNKYAVGFNDLIIVTDSDDNNDYNSIDNLNLNIVIHKEKVPEIEYNDHLKRGIGYIWQQIVKLYAFNYSDADAYIMLDSDYIFTEHFSINSYKNNIGKFTWHYRDWNIFKDSTDKCNEMKGDINDITQFCHTKWSLCTKYIFPKFDNVDTMVLPHFVITKSILESLHLYLKQEFNKTVYDLMFDSINIEYPSEFQIIGNFIRNTSNNDYELINCDQIIIPDSYILQCQCQSRIENFECFYKEFNTHLNNSTLQNFLCNHIIYRYE